MSIYAMASAAWKTMCQANNLPPPLVDRCDDKQSENNLIGTPYTFIASHLPYGLHQNLVGLPMLMTVLRDPIQRLHSAFVYDCIRSHRKLEISRIPCFIQDSTNANLMTKLLSGKRPDQKATTDDLNTVVERLSVEFDFVATTLGIPAISESFLQRFSLPNVLMTRINSAPINTRIDMNPFLQEIHEINHLDIALFKIFSERDPILPLAVQPENRQALHPLTVVMTECGDEDASLFWGTLIDTQRLYAEDLIGPSEKPNDNAIDRFVNSHRA